MKIEAPKLLDGATVLSITKTPEDFGLAANTNGHDVLIAALAIAQYEDSEGFYLFACDSEWNVVGDLFYDTTSDAKRDAERFYETGPIQWIDTAIEFE